jgi:hypothetical protein
MDVRRRLLGKVIAVHADIEFADRYGMTPDAFERLSESFGQKDTTPLNARQGYGFGVVIAFSNLVRDPRQHAMHRGGVQEHWSVSHLKPSLKPCAHRRKQ